MSASTSPSEGSSSNVTDTVPQKRFQHGNPKILPRTAAAVPGPSGANGITQAGAPLEMTPHASNIAEIIDLTWMDPIPSWQHLHNGNQHNRRPLKDVINVPVEILGEAGPSGRNGFKRAFTSRHGKQLARPRAPAGTDVIDLTGLSDDSDDEPTPRKRTHFSNGMEILDTATSSINPLGNLVAPCTHPESLRRAVQVGDDHKTRVLPMPPASDPVVPQLNTEVIENPLPLRLPQFSEIKNAPPAATRHPNLEPDPRNPNNAYLEQLKLAARQLEAQLTEMLLQKPAMQSQPDIEKKMQQFKQTVGRVVEEMVVHCVCKPHAANTKVSIVETRANLPIAPGSPLHRSRLPLVLSPPLANQDPMQATTGRIPVFNGRSHYPHATPFRAETPAPLRLDPHDHRPPLAPVSSVALVLRAPRLDAETPREDLAAGGETLDALSDYQRMLQLEAQALVPNTETFGCAICLCECAPGEGVVLRECVHSFCRDCLGEHVRHCDEERVVCPYREDTYACDAVIQERELRALVSSADYDKHLAKTVRLAESRMPDSFHCRTANCSGWCVHDEQATTFLCPLCEKTNCLKCEAIHTGETCEDYKARVAFESELSGASKNTRTAIEKLLKNGSAMHCPRCKVLVMKDKGCDWLQCGMCKLEICWARRMARWGPCGYGDNSGGCLCRVGGQLCHPKCKNCH